MRTSLKFCLGLAFTMLFVAAGGGCGTPSFLVTPVSSSTKLTEEDVQPGKGGGKVVIIPVEGMLANVRSGGFLQPTENPVSEFIQELNKAAEDNDVKAVVLRINSPGGTVTASDLMFQAVNDFRTKTKKPVVASTQEMAASGGYYVTCAADQIVAHPTSVVGSIGVIFESFEVQELMGKIGVKNIAIKSGPLKDMGSPFKELGPEERQVMQGMVDDYYGRFKEIVKSRRKVRPEDFAMVTDGRVFTGTRAVELGLADRTGRLEDALDLARQLGKAPGGKAVIYKRPYGYGGSIYASSDAGVPHAEQPNTTRLEIPGSQRILPGGFYYLWQPGL
jgi:protease-4